MIVVTGGPPTALVEFMYAPVILAAFRFGTCAGLMTGVIGGITAGPVVGLIAIGASFLTAHQISESVIRVAWFAAIGTVLGAAFTYARRKADALELHLHTDLTTSLPNHRAACKFIDATVKNRRANNDVLVNALRVFNYQDMMGALGHEHTELAMRSLGERMCANLPHGTFVGRTSPDMFTIIEPVRPEESTDVYAKRLENIDAVALPAGDVSVYANISLGVVRTQGSQVDPQIILTQAAIAAADTHRGDASYGQYDPARDESRKDGLRLLSEIDQAIESGQLRLYYQPKLSLRQGKFSGLEALARWQHPERGMLSPAQFIPLVEQTRAIDTFTRWVLREAIGQIVTWRRNGYTPSVAVNISTRNLTSDSLLQYIQNLLQENDVAASSLELEITESALMNVRESRIELLRGLQREGVKIAMDDFGTGYASLANLRDLPIDILKLDRSFIRAAPGRRADLKIVRRIIQMARDLKLEVVAEGVEDAAMLRLLNQMGCDHAQGFFIAKPLPKDRIEELLAKGWRTGNQSRRP